MGWWDDLLCCPQELLTVTVGQRARPFSPVSWIPGHSRLASATCSHMHIERKFEGRQNNTWDTSSRPTAV